MLRKNTKGRRSPKGCAELVFRITKDVINSNTIIDNIHSDDYMAVLPSPVPLQEIDSPVDIYKMYIDGALLIGSENKHSKKETLSELPRLPTHGDMVLLHFNEFQSTHCFMIVDPRHITKDMLELYGYHKEQGCKYGSIYLNKHENFQHRWKRR